jgi:hypothetical protein
MFGINKVGKKIAKHAVYIVNKCDTNWGLEIAL